MSFTISFQVKKSLVSFFAPITPTVTNAPEGVVVEVYATPSFENIYTIIISTPDPEVLGYKGTITYYDCCCNKRTQSIIVIESNFAGTFHYPITVPNAKSSKPVTVTLIPQTN